MPERTVRDRLHARGVVVRTRGGHNREDRLTVPADALTELYVRAGLSAAEAGRPLGVSGRAVLRAAHDYGLPVRIGGPPPRRGPTQIELVDALYAGPLVRCALARHGIARVPAFGLIWQRFPATVELGPEAQLPGGHHRSAQHFPAAYGPNQCFPPKNARWCHS